MVTKQRPKRPRSPNVTIKITEAEIQKAIPKDSGHCMIADAVKRIVPTAEHVAVDLQSIRWSDRKRGVRYTYLTPAIAQMALLRFDDGIKVEPFQFIVRKAHITRMNITGSQTKRIPKNKTLVSRGNGVPEPIGGRAPGRGALANDASRISGKRRAFGLRAMGRSQAAKS